MKPRILFLLICCLASLASAQDSTRAGSVSSRLPYRGIHLGLGGGVMPYLDTRMPGAGAAEVKLALTLREFPDWSVAFTTSSVVNTDTTSYRVRGPAFPQGSFHPDLMSTAIGLEVQRRWDQANVVHPMGTASLGGIMN